MSMEVNIYKRYNILADRLSAKYSKLWVAAEILLFINLLFFILTSPFILHIIELN